MSSESDISIDLTKLKEEIFEREIFARLAEIKKDIVDQTANLVSASTSLEAMHVSGITQLYASRAAASEDIAQDLTDRNVTEIRIMGVSLNDFLRSDQPLNKAWRVIEKYIRGDNGGEKSQHREARLDIKALVVDPNCKGAYWRSKAEHRSPLAISGRLRTDVMSTARHMENLERLAKENYAETGVSFEFRFYQSSPILFLCRTDTVSYVQQYYFWKSRYADVPDPVIKYRTPSTQSYSMHDEMKDHFDWIWDEASMSSSKFITEGMVGIDKGISQAGVINVFYNQQDARKRFLWLLRDADAKRTQKLYIQGISLHSFFGRGDLFQAIMRLAKKGTEIKILLLDPDSEQARFRSYREYILEHKNSDMTFEDYCADNERLEQSQLYRDTEATIKTIQKARASESFKSVKLEARRYKSAPACFMFMVDDSVLVEQYHYGKQQPEEEEEGFATILGKDMPLFEHERKREEKPDGEGVNKKRRADLSDKDPFDMDLLRNPYKLLKDHFEFVFETSDPI